MKVNSENALRARIRARISNSVFLLPNLITTGNLFFGYFSIIKSVQGQFLWAAGAIFLGAIFDMLDGRVARLTKGTSEFGVQYDSLCDLISFGMAPSFLMYFFALHDVSRMGWILCFIFTACTAIRLARFNVQSSIGKTSGNFVGLPSPMAAGVVTSFVAMIEDFRLDSPYENFYLQRFAEFLLLKDMHKLSLMILCPLVGFLMISNISYVSHKSIKLKGVSPFKLLAGVATVLGCAAYNPAVFSFIVFASYALIGLFRYLMGWEKEEDDEPDPDLEFDEEQERE